MRPRATRAGRAQRGSDRSASRAERSARRWSVGDREDVAVRGRPDRLRHVAEVEAPAAERAVAEDGRRAEDRRRTRRSRDPDERARRHRGERAARAAPRQRSPSTSSLARVAVGGTAAGADPARELRLGGEPAHRRGQRRAGRRAGRAARSRRRAAALGRAGVSAVTSGVPQASAWNALFGITRPAFADVPKTPSAQPARWSSCRQPLVVDPVDPLDVRRAARASSASSWPLPTIRNGISGASRAAARIVSSPCSGISLPTKSAWKRSGGCQPGRKSRSSAPTKQTAEPLRRQRRRARRGGARSASVSATTRSAAAEGAPVDAAEHARGGRPGREAAAVLDEGLVERDERVEDDRPAARDPLRRRQVEVAGIADDQRVERLAPAPSERRASASAERAAGAGSERPVVPPPSQTPDVPLDDLDPGAAEARDHLRVPRIVALVRAEVEEPSGQRRISSTCSSALRRSPVRSSWWLAMSSLTRPSESELDADDDEQDAERQQRPVADRLAGQLDARSGRRARASRAAPRTRPTPPKRCSGRCR